MIPGLFDQVATP